MKRYVEGSVRASPIFVIALSIVSILGFLAIMLMSFFEMDISEYIEPLLMLIIGVALILEARINHWKGLRAGLSSNNLNQLVTAVVGFLAIISGIFSFPQIRIEHHVFLAMKGILSIIAILVIIVQTWVVEKNHLATKKKANPLQPSK